MNKKELTQKIISKKEFSQLPEKDIGLAFQKFDREIYSDEEKIKLTRNLLRKVFSSFASQKILAVKDKPAEWILRKHLSTRERLPHYKELYERILDGFAKRANIFDLGAGVNGFSYNYFKKTGIDANYVGVEAVGQLVDLMNFYFRKNKFNAKAIHLSLFELGKIKELIKEYKGQKMVLLFKTLDSLEMLSRDFSKTLLKELAPITDRIVVSFATRSFVKRKKFRAERNWIINFIRNNFKIIDNFESGDEKYIVFKKGQTL
jgi:hypothetical protein